MLKCSELIGKNTIDTYYEFLFCMALAAECGRRGGKLDIRDMRIFDKGMLSEEDIGYLHYLRKQGMVIDGSVSSDDYTEDSNKKPPYYFDTNAITELYDVLMKDTDEGYSWSINHICTSYKSWSGLSDISKVGKTVMHIAAHFYVCFKLGERPVKPVRFYYGGTDVKTPSLYLDLYACCQLPYMVGFEVILEGSYIDKLGDLEFNILYGTAHHAGRLKKWEYDKKFEVFDRMGWGEGTILVCYKRGRVSKNNMVGTILGASIVRIDKIYPDLPVVGQRGKTGWDVTEYAVSKTKEELENDYVGITEDVRYLYSDMLNPTLKGVSTFLPFETVGIGSYFYDEENILLPIEKSGKVSKLVTVDGKRATVEMNEVEAVYWILRQYGVDFDVEKYKDMYNNGQPLMWDTCDPAPLLTAKREVGRYTDEGDVRIDFPDEDEDYEEDEAYAYANYEDDDDAIEDDEE